MPPFRRNGTKGFRRRSWLLQGDGHAEQGLILSVYQKSMRIGRGRFVDAIKD
jgi:hypothetical protein